MPAVRWAYDALKARQFFVVGLEEVWSRCSCEIAKDAIKAAGGELVGESYTVPLTPERRRDRRGDPPGEARRRAQLPVRRRQPRVLHGCTGRGSGPTSCR